MKNKTLGHFQIFRPDFTYSLLFVVMSSVMFSGMIMAIQFAMSISNLLVLLPMAIQLSAWVICIPLVRTHFSISINPDGIQGPNGIFPFFSIKKSFSWSYIRGIQRKNYFLFTWVEVKGKDQDQKILIPGGLSRYDEFCDLIQTWAPPDNPMHLIFTLGKKYQSNKSDSQKLKEKSINVTLSGLCRRQDSNHQSLPVLTVDLKKGVIQVAQTRTNLNNQFFLEVSVVPGSYILSVQTMDLKGELRIEIKRGYYGGLVVPVKRRVML
jgi:hypothetical protein